MLSTWRLTLSLCAAVCLIRKFRVTVYTGKIAAGGIWASKSGKNAHDVAEHPDVNPTDVP